jgi:hypothetical protein
MIIVECLISALMALPLGFAAGYAWCVFERGKR